MKRLLFCLFFSFAIFQGFSQTDNKIVLGTIDSLQSKILHEQRKIWVYVPNRGQAGIHSKVKYPVVYLLDGDALFYSVVGMIQQLSSNGNSVFPEMIVVGIPNTDRTRDLTPTPDSNAAKTSGGGEQFIAFIEKELIPYIDSTYPTSTYKTLIGHSLGGLTVINTLINHKDLFDAYIAIDPSMSWDNKRLLKKAAEVLPKDNYRNKTLFLGIANTIINKEMDTTSVRKDTASITEHIRSILTLNDLLKKNKNNGLSYDYKYYINDSHLSVPLIATYDALRFIFNFYDFQFIGKEFKTMDAIAKIENHYENVFKHLGYKYYPPEWIINQLAYNAMSDKKMAEAELLFKMNITNYPTSANVYDSIGDFEVAKGDKAKAIEYFKKALSIKENADTRNKLNDLLKK
jgi:hypothetical protein